MNTCPEAITILVDDGDHFLGLGLVRRRKSRGFLKQLIDPTKFKILRSKASVFCGLVNCVALTGFRPGGIFLHPLHDRMRGNTKLEANCVSWHPARTTTIHLLMLKHQTNSAILELPRNFRAMKTIPSLRQRGTKPRTAHCLYIP